MFDLSYVKAEYNKGRSIREIARELGVNQSTLSRAMKADGQVLRTRSESMKLAMEQGRARHPTSGMGHSKETRERISDSVAAAWEAMPESKREERSEWAREHWKGKLNGSADGLRKAAGEGSQLERYLFKALSESFECLWREVVGEDRLDILIPRIRVAIDVTGVALYQPVWGEDRLDTARQKAQEKVARVQAAGWAFIRVKCVERTVSDHLKRRLFNQLSRLLETVQPGDFHEME